MHTRDALAGCLLGQALGDALGFVVEAAPPDVAAAYVTGTLRAGRAGKRSRPGYSFGQYSDDTQLARELLCSIRDAGGWDPEVFARRIAALFGERRDVGAGQGTRAAAGRLLSGTPWRESGTPAPYAGNGSAMRAAPLGVMLRDHPEDMRRAAVEQSIITHRDSRCVAGSIAIAGAAALAARRRTIDPGGFLEQLAVWTGAEDRTMAVALRSVGGLLDLPPEGAARCLHESGLDAAYADRWQGISGFVIPSVVWSLYAFLRSPDDYWSTVCTAIAVGGDTDTMAAMAGAISGARVGVAGLPASLLESLHDRDTWRAAELTIMSEGCPSLPVA